MLAGLRAWAAENLRMGDLPRPARVWIVLVVTAASLIGPVLLAAWPGLVIGPALFGLLALALVGSYIEERILNLSSYGIQGLQAPNVISLFTLVATGSLWAGTLVIIACTALQIRMRAHRPVYRHAFNVALYLLNFLLTGACFLAAGGLRLDQPVPSLILLTAAPLVGVTWNALILSVIVALASGGRLSLRHFVHEIVESAGQDGLRAGVLLAAAACLVLAGPLLAVAALLAVELPLLVALTPAALSQTAILNGSIERQARLRTRRAKLVTEIASELEAAETDPLTGLPGLARRDADLARAEQDRRAVLYLAGDVAGLRAVNDYRSHDAGNQLLRLAAEAMRAVLRRGDAVYRIGGDEFALLINARDSADVESLTERINARFRRELAAAPELAGVVSFIRFGVAHSHDGFEGLCQRADQELVSRAAADRAAGRIGHV